uniref:Uncharacterized protein n=1 Tax=Rhizophora mucronata TaxID=61149 RepID=A0A2P2R1V0_RHIMU
MSLSHMTFHLNVHNSCSICIRQILSEKIAHSVHSE